MLIGYRFFYGLAEPLLLAAGKALPDGCADDQNIRNGGMLIDDVIVRYLIMAGAVETRRIVFCPVYDPALESGIEFAVGDRRGRSAQLTNQPDGHDTRLNPDFHASHIPGSVKGRSEEHTSELQSRGQLVCRLLPAQ